MTQLHQFSFDERGMVDGQIAFDVTDSRCMSQKCLADDLEAPPLEVDHAVRPDRKWAQAMPCSCGGHLYE